MKRMLPLLLILAACAPKPAATTSTSTSTATATTTKPVAVATAPTRYEPAVLDVAPLQYKWTPDALAAACEQAEKTSDATLAKLVAIPDDKRSFADSFEALDRTIAQFSDTTSRLGFMKDVHPDAKVRAAGSACEERAGKYYVKVSARKDLYLAMKGYLDHQGKADKLDPQQQRLVELTMRDFHRAGLDLSDADREKLIALRSRLAELQTQFSSNLDETTNTIEVTKKELDGLPASFFDHLKKNGDKFVVTTAYPDYYPVMESCKVEATRRKMEVAFMSRAADKNIALLNEAIRVRDQAAKLLGYKTHSDFVAEDRMAKDATTVAVFEAKLQKELEQGLAAETAKMKAIKSKETHQKNPTISSWDWRYYENQIKKQDYTLDDEQIRSYFPADKVMAGLFEVYSKVLGVSFEEVPGADVWAEGVKLYTMKDAASGKPMAKFYVDLYPRDGKYGHAASFGLGPAYQTDKGYQMPLNALVVNFNPPANGQVAHLSIEEVDTLFHEFGHVMHGSLTDARYASQSGTNVALDFVEAPSQMFENWVFQPEVLALVSRDPKDPSKTIPNDLVRKIIAARTYNAGVKYTRQVFLGVFDQAIHTCGRMAGAEVATFAAGGTKDDCGVDSDATARNLWEKILAFPEDKDEHFAATFGHMMGGYDGGYYGYLWSEVFADDMFTRFEKEGVLSPVVGKALREQVLSKGRIEDPDKLLKTFLGREPNEDAFLRITGIKSQS